MRRFSLLLCLLAIAMLGWIIGPAEATTATVQKDAGVSKTHLALDATNTGSKDISVASGTRTADEASITHELPSSAIAASRHSTATIPYQPNQRAQFHLIVIDAGQVTENLPTAAERS